MVHLRQLASIVILSAAGLALHGCLISDMSGGTTGGVTSVQATATLTAQSPCVVNATAQSTTCTPVMVVGADGITQSFQFLITLLGYTAPLTLYDPLIVQVPASMSNFAGSIAIGPPGIAPNTPLSILSGLTSVPIDANTNLVAEPGMQLVIIDFQAPNGAPFGTYTLKLQFSGTASSIKVVFAGKVVAGANTYYVPIYPCVTSFANVLPISLPVVSLAGLIPLIVSAQGCNGQNYNFSGLGPPGVNLNQDGLTGSWYDAADSGQGVEVEVFPDAASGTGSTFVSWFTYDTVAGGEGAQRWYTAQGPVVTGQANASLTIYQNIGGNFNAPPATTAQAVGTATLSFSTCTSGQLAYSFSDGSGRMGNIPLTRLTQNVTCSTTAPYPTNADFAFSGNWYGGAATSGQGFTAEVNPNSATFFAAWYTYEPMGAAAGAAGQRWYTAQGSFTPGMRSIPVTIYETTGGVFNMPPPASQKTVAVGSGTMAFQSCTAATFSYNFTAGSSSGLSGTIALSRVGPVPPGCTS
jgi:hypothetical protein